MRVFDSCRRGDSTFVVISLNHRLNALGFLNLAAYGSQYASSANVGMLDIVMALEWVRDNISRFGGSSDNVTLMGQSGDGRKVTTLLAMPAAKNLFHRAIIHSGSLLTVGLPGETAPIAAATLKELGLSHSQLDKLQTIPVMHLIDARKSGSSRHRQQSSIPRIARRPWMESSYPSSPSIEARRRSPCEYRC